MNQKPASPNEPVVSAAADQLPPVQPPAATFLVQLFLIPLLIVSIIVGVWLLFSWLARAQSPEDLVKDISRLNHSSWQQALTLAQQLRDPGRSDLRENEALAQQLSQLLQKQLEEGKSTRDFVQLRMYLCRALGEFDVATGLPALADAAVRERNAEELDVRRAGLQAIGILLGRMKLPNLDEYPEVSDAVLQGTEEYAESGDEKYQREMLRSTATFTLGLVPGDAATERLAVLADDPSLDVAYNAAIGLARRGDRRAIPVLADMLDPPIEALDSTDPNLDDKEKQRQREWKRTMVIGNGLRAIAKMHLDHPQADLGPLPEAVVALAANTSLPAAITLQAAEVAQLVSNAAKKP